MADVANAVLDAVTPKHHHIHPHPAKIFEHVTHFGSNVLWVTFIIFAVTFVIFAVKTAQIKPAERANAYTSLFIVGIAGMAYYAMATGLGVTYKPVHGHLHHYRSLFYARYIDWIFTTPLLLLELVLLSGLDLGSTIWIFGADVAMIVTGLFGAFESGRPKWGWFLAGCVFMIVVMVGLLKNGSDAAYRRNDQLGRLYTMLTGSLLVLWWVYPIVWALSEGKAKVSSDTEVLAYAVLDVLAKKHWHQLPSGCAAAGQRRRPGHRLNQSLRAQAQQKTAGQWQALGAVGSPGAAAWPLFCPVPAVNGSVTTVALTALRESEVPCSPGHLVIAGQ